MKTSITSCTIGGQVVDDVNNNFKLVEVFVRYMSNRIAKAKSTFKELL